MVFKFVLHRIRLPEFSKRIQLSFYCRVFHLQRYEHRLQFRIERCLPMATRRLDEQKRQPAMCADQVAGYIVPAPVYPANPE